MKNVVAPRTVSFEDALRNLATKLTGTPVNELPRTQEGVVQFMAEHVPSADEMAEAITQEVIARLTQADATSDGEPAATEQDAPENSEQAQGNPTEEPQAKTSGKSRKSK